MKSIFQLIVLLTPSSIVRFLYKSLLITHQAPNLTREHENGTTKIRSITGAKKTRDLERLMRDTTESESWLNQKVNNDMSRSFALIYVVPLLYLS